LCGYSQFRVQYEKIINILNFVALLRGQEAPEFSTRPVSTWILTYSISTTYSRPSSLAGFRVIIKDNANVEVLPANLANGSISLCPEMENQSSSADRWKAT